MEKLFITSDQFKEHISILEEHFRCGEKNGVSEGVIKIRRLGYWEMLKGCDVTELRAGIATAISNLKFLPSARELKELCYGGKTDEQRAFEKRCTDTKLLLESHQQKHPEILEQNRDAISLLWKYNSLLLQKGHSQQEIIAMAKDGSIKDVLLGYFKKPDDYGEVLLLDSDAPREPLEKQRQREFISNRERALKLIEKWKQEGAS